MIAGCVAALVVFVLVWAFSILRASSIRARAEERAVNEWLREQGRDPIYPE